ncbi:MAG: S8 family serine peptidase [Planctomycetota bacterium]
MKREIRFWSGLVLVSFWVVVIAGCAAGSGQSQPGVQADEQTNPPTEQPGTAPGSKIRIEKLDDLPQHTYPYRGQLAELVKSRIQVLELASKMRADVEADLAQYEIGDATTLQRMYSTLVTIDLLEKNYDAVLRRQEQIRALENKEAKKLTGGMLSQSMIAARREVGENADSVVYKQAFRRQLAKRVAVLPWDIVQDVIKENKARAQLVTETLVMGMIQAQMQPVVDQNGELSADMAAGVVGMHLMLAEQLPLKDEIIAVMDEKINANQQVKPDIWAAREVTLSADQTHGPVLVAAWDSGTDPDVFEPCLFTNPGECFDGEDTDGNGFVDDVHGIAYDIDARRTTDMLCPLGDAAGRIDQVMEHIKGLMDLQAAIDSPEADALRKHIGSLDPQDVQGFIEDLGLAGNYAHGTHVAGIMARGNPCIQLLIARLSYDYRTKPVARTLEWGARDAAKCRDTVDYFKEHGVRVVNMSWGEAQEDAELSLERNGIGESAEQRRELARQVFGLQRAGLHEAIKNAPDILFVGAAGNADNDVEFDEYIPSSFDLPNLLIVGAVDQAGEPTSFTSFGRTVQVYANGFEVESFVPGGATMKMSGTSMASPNVANLAAKLLALDPHLSPTEVIELIKKGAERKTEGGQSYLLMNPKRSVELLTAKL